MEMACSTATDAADKGRGRRVIYRDIPRRPTGGRQGVCRAHGTRRTGTGRRTPEEQRVQEVAAVRRQGSGRRPEEASGQRVHTRRTAQRPHRVQPAARQGRQATQGNNREGNEYVRWRMHKGQPPEKRRRRPEPQEAEWPYSAYLEWNAMIKKGVPPGEIPARLAEGYAEYLGKSVNKYTPCGPPGRKNGQGCRGRHGDGPGAAALRPGSRVLQALPEGVHRRSRRRDAVRLLRQDVAQAPPQKVRRIDARPGVRGPGRRVCQTTCPSRRAATRHGAVLQHDLDHVARAGGHTTSRGPRRRPPTPPYRRGAAPRPPSPGRSLLYRRPA